MAAVAKGCKNSRFCWSFPPICCGSGTFLSAGQEATTSDELSYVSVPTRWHSTRNTAAQGEQLPTVVHFPSRGFPPLVEPTAAGNCCPMLKPPGGMPACCDSNTLGSILTYHLVDHCSREAKIATVPTQDRRTGKITLLHF